MRNLSHRHRSWLFPLLPRSLPFRREARQRVGISLEQLGGEADDECPSAVQLCEMAGDYRQLREVARKKGDFVGFAAGILHGSPVLK